jgi:hypothetical protein
VSNEGDRQVDDERVAFLSGFKRVWRVLDRPYTWAADPSFLLTVLFEDGSTAVWECGSAA